MQAIILVGGEGTRLRPLTYDIPKPMVPLLGRPFIGWIIERLRAAGVRDVILSCCYLPEVIEAHFGDGASAGVKLHYVFEEEPLGTAGAIRNALDLIHGPLFVCNGDILTGLDLVGLARYHESHGALASIHTRAVPDPSQFGVVETDASGRVLRFVEKPQPGETKARDINAGTYILEREAVEAIAPGRNVSIERETFPELIASTGRVFAMSTDDYWIDVGRPETYQQAHRDILDGRFERPRACEVRPGIWCANGAKPSPGVEFHAPAFFGAGARAEVGASVGPYTALYEGVVVRAGARIARSIAWPNARIGARAIVEDAIVGLGISVPDEGHIEPGAVLGREPEKAPA